LPTVLEFVDSVCKSEALQGGTCVRRFSQALPPVSNLSNMYGVTTAGIGMALANRWIVDHAFGGSFWEWLCTKDGQIQQSKVANLMINFMDGAAARTEPRPHSQALNAERYLHQNSFIRRPDLRVGAPRPTPAASATTESPGARLGLPFGKAIATPSEPALKGTYRLVSVASPSGDLAMAAWAGRDVRFFDPNFGEFHVPDAKRFPAWFARFWQVSGYAESAGALTVQDYVPKAVPARTRVRAQA
jgi:YopT peptidase